MQSPLVSFWLAVVAGGISLLGIVLQWLSSNNLRYLEGKIQAAQAERDTQLQLEVERQKDLARRVTETALLQVRSELALDEGVEAARNNAYVQTRIHLLELAAKAVVDTAEALDQIWLKTSQAVAQSRGGVSDPLRVQELQAAIFSAMASGAMLPPELEPFHRDTIVAYTHTTSALSHVARDAESNAASEPKLDDARSHHVRYALACKEWKAAQWDMLGLPRADLSAVLNMVGEST